MRDSCAPKTYSQSPYDSDGEQFFLDKVALYIAVMHICKFLVSITVLPLASHENTHNMYTMCIPQMFTAMNPGELLVFGVYWWV